MDMNYTDVLDELSLLGMFGKSCTAWWYVGKQVTDSCKQYGGFYLGSVGGAAAVLAEDCIKKVEAGRIRGERDEKLKTQNTMSYLVILMVSS